MKNLISDSSTNTRISSRGEQQENPTIGVPPLSLIPECDLEMIKSFATLLSTDEGCVEMRVLGNKNASKYEDRQNLIGFFDCPDAIAREALKYNGKKAVYLGLNPRQKEMLDALSPNQLHPGAQGGKASNVLCRRFFPIDIDTRKPDPRLAASDSELMEAARVSSAIFEHLLQKGIFPITAFSGNGNHLLVPTIPYPFAPNEEIGANDHFALLLRWFGRNFSTPGASVDEGNFDPARIWKTYGTSAVKGANTIERPWRRATYEMPSSPQLLVDILEIYRTEISEQLEFESSPRKKTLPLGTKQVAQISNGTEILERLKERGLWIKASTESKHYIACPWAEEHTSGQEGDSSTVYFDGTAGKGPGFKCLHSHCGGRNLGDLLRFIGADRPKEIIRSAQRKTRPLELLSLDELYKRPDEKVPYLVENMLRMGGVSVIAAKPKVGKTTLVRYLSLCVARGQPFLGRATAQGSVIVLAMEEILEEMKRHYREMGASGSEPIYVHAAGTPDRLIEVLEEEIARIKPTLVVLDTLFRAITVDDGNSYAVMTAALEPFQDLARRTGVHLLLVHHLGKSEREGADGILGSTAIFGAVDGAIILNKKQDGTRTIKTESRYGKNLEETELEFDDATRTFKLAGTVKENAIERIQEKLLEYIRHASPDVTASQIEESGGMRKQSWRIAIRQLIKDGKVSFSGNGKKNDPFLYSINASYEARRREGVEG